MTEGILVWAILLIPVLFGLSGMRMKSAMAVLTWLCAGVCVEAAALVALFVAMAMPGTPTLAWGWFYLDALSAYHLGVLMLVFLMSTFYARGYFGHEIQEGKLTIGQTRRFAGLWGGALSAMVLVLISNNVGVMWIGIEATTLITAFLICIHRTPASIEAMWKYLLMCSVGVACAFMGTLLIASAARPLGLPDSEILLWTRLRAGATLMNQPSLKLAFLFVLVGYGTKVGLAPLHSWLPDAHSQAPAPVSAVFSGFLLNTALYCIMRYVAIVEAATGGSGWSRHILSAFGVISIVVAAAFILFQKDLKRLLAYSSVEHMGIISLGIGLGGIGVFAALFHVFNNSVCKTLAFFSAGRLDQACGTHEISRLRGTLRAHPLWGAGLLGALLALIGVAPFAVFMSEFQIMAAAVGARSYLALALFLAGSGAIFVAVLKHAIAMAWGDAEAPVGPPQASRAADWLIVVGSLGVLLALGLYMPDFLRHVLERAAAIVEGKS